MRLQVRGTGKVEVEGERGTVSYTINEGNPADLDQFCMLAKGSKILPLVWILGC